ncbi:MAG: HDOD domain-containing protein [Desulfarculaceae bacterium]|jgi:EAL and modified HD-GYP domain-containing signal transduction protein
MERFIARQPILNEKLGVYGYELLFRSGVENFFHQQDGDQASSRVIADSLLLFGMEALTHGAKAFINFTRRLLLEKYALTLPRSLTVVEILETVEPEAPVLEACRILKQKGFKLALDDFVQRPDYAPLLEMADIVKVDFLESDGQEQQRLAETLLPRGIVLLAEKVETQEDFSRARSMGYTLFQGYFFSKPVIVARKDLPSSKLHYLRLLKEINAAQMDFDSLSRLVGTDASMSYKLLRYINSAAFGVRQQVNSLKQAVTLLGENQIRQWASLLAVYNLGDDRPVELMATAVIRARFSELLAAEAGLARHAPDLFLIGLFSLLDAMLGRPQAEILEELNLGDDVTAALLKKEGRLALVLELVKSYEQGRWEEVDQACAGLGLDKDHLPEQYLQAAQFASYTSTA